MTDDSSLLAHGRRPLTIGLVLIVTGIAFEALATATIMPVVARELTGIHLYGWAFSAFMLAQLVAVAVGGPIGDRRGPARPFTVGLVLFGVGLVGAGIAPSMELLVLARVVQGAGAGLVFSMAYVAIGLAYPRAARGHLLAVLSSAWVVPGILGPAVAGFVAQHVGWRVVFLGLVPLLPLAGALTLPSLVRHGADHDPDVEHPATPALDALRLGIGAGLVLAGLGARSPFTLVGFVVIGALVGVPSFQRLVPAGTARARGPLPAAIAVRGLTSFAFFGAEAFVPLALTSVRGWSPAAAGIALTFAALTWTAGAWAQAHRSTQWGRRRTIRAGLAFVAVGVAVTALVLLPDVPAVVAPLAWAVAGFGMGLASPTASLVVLEEAPPGRVGASTAALQLTDTLGFALGAGIGGAAVALAVAEGWDRAVGIGIAHAIAVVAGLVGLPAARHLRGREAIVPAGQSQH